MSDRRSIKIIVVSLIAGAMIGTLLGNLLGNTLPDGVVKRFFLESVDFSLGGILGKDHDAVSLDIGIMALIFGFKIKLNFSGLMGLAVAYYFLRYFR